MTTDETPSRPISVAELLAKNGTIGSPPVSGRRRRRRGNSDAVTVAELTGEIPIIRTGAIPIVREDETDDAVNDVVTDDAADTAQEPAVEVPETTAGTATNGSAPAPDTGPVTAEAPRPFAVPPQRSEAPTPRRERGPERSHDPRPLRRPSAPAAETDSDAEQMAFDPVDEAALAVTAEEHEDGAAELQSYLRSSGGTLFGGQTVADDLARRGVAQDEDQDADRGAAAVATEDAVYDEDTEPREGKLAALWRALIAVGQSFLAVAFGAGLFIAFDQLWRWNNIVALVLSVLVILGLVAAVRLVRKTEDFASTLIAVAVGALVTFGPLALLSST
ncbi:hypothetical protein MANY_47200 [Mycolicibacterium anyangense]|uniref:Transmembrane protein n=1 Tax=Mycolicibacterium anyangense TaxID=1431246 RepID=A0A6N4WG32_9MYCO|nr:hypothetical protein [Mycolicibacterium anyangense]BBZ79383.1 hypothetical protein MANY_47200 [Mycolicibacterium anyangense]